MKIFVFYRSSRLITTITRYVIEPYHELLKFWQNISLWSSF